MSDDLMTKDFTLREGATIVALVSECGDERVLQMTEDEAKDLRAILVSLLDDEDDE